MKSLFFLSTPQTMSSARLVDPDQPNVWKWTSGYERGDGYPPFDEWCQSPGLLFNSSNAKSRFEIEFVKCRQTLGRQILSSDGAHPNWKSKKMHFSNSKGITYGRSASFIFLPVPGLAKYYCIMLLNILWSTCYYYIVCACTTELLLHTCSIRGSHQRYTRCM